jgi:large subunit ribosomal protein L22
MEYQAQLRFVRVTPRKMGLLVDQIRGKSVNEALNFLSLSPRRRVADALSALLRSAVANAEQKSKGSIDIDNLFVKTALVGKGPTLKRFRPRAKGSASPILKRTSHVTLSVAEK